MVRLDPEVLEMLITDVDEQIASFEQQLEQLRAERYGLHLSLARLTGRGPVQAEQTKVPILAAVESLRPVQDGEPAKVAPTRQVDDTSTAPTFVADPEWAALTMTDAVLRVVEMADRPLGPQDVAASLNAVGIPAEGTTAVRGALGYLKRQKPPKLALLGRGKWVIAGGPLDTTSRTDPAAEIFVGAVGSNNDEGPAGEAGPVVRDDHSQEVPGV